MEVVDLLLAKARDYEIRAASYSETATLCPGNGTAAAGFTLVAIALREVADALEEAA